MADPPTPALRPVAPPVLVGREPEQAVLRGAFVAALAGRGSLVLLGGEAGIGKTALAEVLLAEATAHGALVLVGRCYDLSETPPYGPWAEAFYRVPRDGDLPTLPPDRGGEAAGSQVALFRQTRDYLAALAARQPLVLLLEDLHWADPASLDLLRFVGRQLGALPLLLLATYRDDELARDHPLYALLPALVREARPSRLHLQALSHEALRALVREQYVLPAAAEARLAAYLHGRGEGNPFFAGELLRALEEAGGLRRAGDGWALGDPTGVAVPALLRQLIDARVDRLGEGARRLLAAAAIIGQEVPLDLLAAVAGADENGVPEAVERGLAAHLLAEASGGAAVRFAHALFREALYEGTMPLRRRATHQRVAEALLATPHPDPDVVASHLQHAGDSRAVGWLVRAGERAQAAYAWLSAADRFETALRLLDERDADAGERAALLVRLGQLCRFADRARSLDYLDRALALADAARDRALAAHARYQRGNVRCLALDFGGGLADEATALADWATLPCDERERVAGPAGLHPHYGRANYANWCALAGRFAEALAIAERYPAAQAGPAATALVEIGTAEALEGLGYACAGLGRPEEAGRALAAARDAYRAARHHEMVAETGRNALTWVVVPYRADRPDERSQILAEVETAEAHVAGMVTDVPPHYARRALLLPEGRWAEAATLAAAVRSRGISHEWLMGTTLLARLARERGERELSSRLVREAMPDGPASEPGDSHFFYRLVLQRVGADLALDAGDLPAARAWLACHDRWLAWAGAGLGRAEGELGWAAYRRAEGDPATARRHAEQALAEASAPRQPLALLAAHRRLGELATADGRHADAPPQLDAALSLAEACAAPYERALTLIALAELRAATGQLPEARPLLDEARAICTSLGARPALARIDALAHDAEGRAVPGMRRAQGQLSPRETAVLRLIAAGRSNKEIAGDLGMSVRTAERHIANLYTKIAATGRAEAIAFAHRHGLL